MKIRAWAAPAAGQPLTPFEYDSGTMGPFDADVQITHCGVCHSDLHLADGDWGGRYPMVPGHEIIGVVTAVGAAAEAALTGQRVGIGWQRSACLHCAYCLHGEDNVCADSQATCADGNYGGFADFIRIDSRFVHPIPAGLDSVAAAPLLCAGITVYEPLRRYGVSAAQHVGVIGIGGLGHLALQFARALGCEVTAFSSGAAKQAEALALGAHHYVNTGEPAALKQQRRRLDFIIATATANLNWVDYVKALRPNGVLCFVGAPSAPITVPIGLLLSDQRSVTGSSIGGRARMREMLALAERHHIHARTEVLPFDQVNTALSRLRQNDVRYRFVLARD
ncbi:MAG: NAD(P)-dependent alcohol dehydrogenase [Anaerolineae bacterium]|jgi:uncharacterized zinc-type alcohol dehydrogenase-like protein|nr:NAD(P)-dependent alcohol dehydrogenase [Anaerolineae bacterium]